MKSHNLRRAFARCGLILMTMSNSQAQPPTTEAASPQAKWPDTFTVTARFCLPDAHRMKQLAASEVLGVAVPRDLGTRGRMRILPDDSFVENG